ncbi:MAG: hypothetical protein GXP08_17950 [Gammaproteobacteria bacterium]|nr:hypothetical protein [Gammaproteobacteria bacterium]
MNKTIKRKLFLSTLAIMLVSMGSLYFVFFTASGLQWYFNRGFDKPEFQITIGEVRHSFNGPVSLRDVSLKSNLFHLHFSQATISWSFVKLLQHKLFIEQLNSNLVTLRISKNFNTTAANRSALPIVSRIENGFINQLRIISTDGSLYNFSNIRLSRIYAHQDLFINAIDFESNYGKFQLAGNIGISSNDIINLNTESSLFTPVGDFNISGKGTIVGTSRQLRFLQKLNAPARTAIEGVVTNPFSLPVWDITIRLELIETKPIDSRWPINIMQGVLVANGTLNNLQVKGSVDVTDEFDKRWTTDIESHVENQRAVFAIKAYNGLKKHQQLINTTGTWNYSSSQPFPENLDVATNWRNIKWPTTGKPTLNSSKGEIKFTGNTLVTQLFTDSVHIEPMGIELTELRLKSKELRGRGNVRQGFSLMGSAISGQGNLDISGYIMGSFDRLKLTQLELTGENFALLRRPEAVLVVSPSISVKNNISHFSTAGYVNIPKATIRLNNLHNNTPQFLSRLINPTLQNNREGTIEDSQLKILFGDNVWFHGYGLNAQVKGSLQFINIRNQQIIAKGRLHVVNGSYNKAGKKIKLQNGFLLYNNMPLDNPELILQLPRKQQEKENRIAITGRLKALHSASKSTINKSSVTSNKRFAYFEGNTD